MNRNRLIHLAVIALVVGIFFVTATPARAQGQAPPPPPATVAPSVQPVPPVVLTLQDLKVLPPVPPGDLADLATLKALADMRGLTMARVDTDALESALRAAVLDDQQAAAKASLNQSQAKVVEAEARMRAIEKEIQVLQEQVSAAADDQARQAAQGKLDAKRSELQAARKKLTAVQAEVRAAESGRTRTAARATAVTEASRAKVIEVESQVRAIERAVRAAQEKVRAAATEQAKATAQAAVDTTRAELQTAQAKLAAAQAAVEAARASWGDSNFDGMDEQSAYEIGSAALDDNRWQRAVNAFDAVVKARGKRADGGYYWKAYAQNRLGQRAESLATLQEMQKAYPTSRWLNDARALEVEVRQSMGQPARPDGESDDDLKLLALRNVLASDPDRAIPAIEKMIQANNSPKVKDQALFVLAQSGSPKALEVLSRIAKGSGNPDLQLKAIRYLGVFGQSGRYILRRDGGSVTVLNGARRSADGKADPKVEDARRANAQMLADIYSASTNLDVKREVLRSFMMTGEKERLLELAKNEKSPELRAEAIRQLGSMGGQTDLYKLYQVDLAAEVRRQIISAMVMSRSADQLLEIARAETDPKLRALAIQNLGVLSSSGWYMGDRRTYALARPAVRAPQAPTPPAAATPPTARTAPTPPAVATPAQPVPPAAAATPRAAAPLVWAAGASSTPVDTVKIGEGLASIYKSDKDADVRKAVIEALYRQQNAKALVDIARVETDPAMKKALVQRLSTMKAKEATDYMLELLK